jgi:hypothetical protein
MIHEITCSFRIPHLVITAAVTTVRKVIAHSAKLHVDTGFCKRTSETTYLLGTLVNKGKKDRSPYRESGIRTPALYLRTTRLLLLLLLLDQHPRSGELRGVAPRTCGCGSYLLPRRNRYGQPTGEGDVAVWAGGYALLA